MIFIEFMSILNGEYKETAGTSAKNQCTDLVNAYIKYVLGLPIIEHTNAKDFPLKAGDKYDYIVNTPNGVPQEGDLVIWGGTYGHIAVFIEGDAKRFTSFDENFPVGSPCHVQEHTYLSPKVLGWLHPRIVQSNPQVQLVQTQEELRKYTGWFVGLCTALGVGASYDLAVAEIQKDTTLNEAIVQKDKTIAEATVQINELSTKLINFQKEKEELVEQMVKDKQEYESNLAARDKTIQTLDTEIKEAVVQIEEMKKVTQEPTLSGWRKTIHDWVVQI